MYRIVIIAFLLTTASAFGNDLFTGTFESVKPSVSDDPVQQCRFSADDLIGLPAAALRSKCGPSSAVRTTFTELGQIEQRTYGSVFDGGPFFHVVLRDGIVATVHVE